MGKVGAMAADIKTKLSYVHTDNRSRIWLLCSRQTDESNHHIAFRIAITVGGHPLGTSMFNPALSRYPQGGLNIQQLLYTKTPSIAKTRGVSAVLATAGKFLQQHFSVVGEASPSCPSSTPVGYRTSCTSEHLLVSECTSHALGLVPVPLQGRYAAILPLSDRALGYSTLSISHSYPAALTVFGQTSKAYGLQ